MADKDEGFTQFAEWLDKALDAREERKDKAAKEQAAKDAVDAANQPKGLLGALLGPRQ